MQQVNTAVQSTVPGSVVSHNDQDSRPRGPGRKQGQKIPFTFTAIPNSFFSTMHERSSTENEVLLALMRYTLGYGCEWVSMSVKRIGELIGKGEKTADRALAGLRSKGLLEQKIGKRNKRLRSWRVAWENFEPTPTADPDFEETEPEPIEVTADPEPETTGVKNDPHLNKGVSALRGLETPLKEINQLSSTVCEGDGGSTSAGGPASPPHGGHEDHDTITVPLPDAAGIGSQDQELPMKERSKTTHPQPDGLDDIPLDREQARLRLTSIMGELETKEKAKSKPRPLKRSLDARRRRARLGL